MTEPATGVEIVPFSPSLAPYFDELNREWLEAMFEMEPVDEELLREPERMIVRPGGHVLFAKRGEDVLGTCGLLLQDDGGFELVKMGVRPSARGTGAGELLMRAALATAREAGASYVFLVTSSSLIPAQRLYEKHGFVVTSREPHPKYARGDVTMRLEL